MDDLERLAAEIDRDATVVALTGAGISAPSGVPTFRGDDGVWDHFDEGQFTYGRFRSDPAGFWEDRIELQRELFGDDYEPNAAHEALTEMEQEGYLDAILTQNTDGLHGDAAAAVADDELENGADATILELHGNARQVRCIDCGRRRDGDPIFERAAKGERPPTCDCDGIYKPDVVLFGEQLPGAAIQRARTLARESDVFLAIGSSLVVEPAASLPHLAVSSDATVGVVNLESTPVDDAADVVCRADVTEAVPRLQSSL
ncbi:SIR2 family NAD-dependent protein deacylase [Natronobacterium gregoryi]|uniref:NAD-dependent protein deacetylase n=2 Tax=Natronobacterium gregoryi TaxID=44930 RepID=L0AJB8_NATGS|nr:Sir2 family NAD-dependent protein deacetylase [Natronobacterium gregoryi]AFZ73267.1 NAD-dependent protein deacetylase, SIR2 family [Natronobacterium gregoryi SP2]ELY71274.1 silent information regulator protein Sir2 [Natronobacterium gregoryi SP2]PLK18766.1 NAD-dependent protein deacetylase [Natronobacterium gregoryi SP2]SFJ64543.1 NAD-dependent deacetylase [Natronobacterium gregoryi]